MASHCSDTCPGGVWGHGDCPTLPGVCPSTHTMPTPALGGTSVRGVVLPRHGSAIPVTWRCKDNWLNLSHPIPIGLQCSRGRSWQCSLPSPSLMLGSSRLLTLEDLAGGAKAYTYPAELAWAVVVGGGKAGGPMFLSLTVPLEDFFLPDMQPQVQCPSGVRATWSHDTPNPTTPCRPLMPPGTTSAHVRSTHALCGTAKPPPMPG